MKPSELKAGDRIKLIGNHFVVMKGQVVQITIIDGGPHYRNTNPKRAASHFMVTEVSDYPGEEWKLLFRTVPKTNRALSHFFPGLRSKVTAKAQLKTRVEDLVVGDKVRLLGWESLGPDEWQKIRGLVGTVEAAIDGSVVARFGAPGCLIFIARTETRPWRHVL